MFFEHERTSDSTCAFVLVLFVKTAILDAARKISLVN